MGGDRESCSKLGNLYLTHYLTEEQRNDDSPGEDSIRLQDTASGGTFSKKYELREYRKLAAEWYELAIADGHSRAALEMAGILRQEKKHDQGLDYLNIAENDPNCADSVKLLRKIW